MTLRELIEQLEDLRDSQGADNLEVMASYDYGDHCHTQALTVLNGGAEIVRPQKSAYSRSGLALPTQTGVVTEDGDEDCDEIVALS